MNYSDIISVNPGKLTLGALHPEGATRLIRTNININSSTVKKHRFLDFIFAVKAPGINRFGKYMLVMRLLFATILISSGCLTLNGSITNALTIISSQVSGILQITAGAMLALGLLTRISILSIGIILSASILITFTNGMPDMSALSSLFTCILFIIMGAGKYSLDFLIRKGVIINATRRRKRNEMKRMTYKAFQYSDSKC